MLKMEDCNFVLIKPHELRKQYTEYVWQNRARAMLPTKLLRQTQDRYVMGGGKEENDNGEQQPRKSMRGTQKSRKSARQRDSMGSKKFIEDQQ